MKKGENKFLVKDKLIRTNSHDLYHTSRKKSRPK